MKNYYILLYTAIFLLGGMVALLAGSHVDAKTAPAPTRSLLAGQAGTAVLSFNGDHQARTAVTLPAPILEMVVVCSGSDDLLVEANVSCQPLAVDVIGITAVIPYTTTHELTVFWLAAERTQ